LATGAPLFFRARLVNLQGVELVLSAMLGISGASALAGAALARARTRRALAI